MALVSSQSSSFSQYLDSDPEFEDALRDIVLPGDLEANGSVQATSNTVAHQDDPPKDQERVSSSKKRRAAVDGDDSDSDDEVEVHLRHKRTKLQSSSQPDSQLNNSQGTSKFQPSKQQNASSPALNRTNSSRTLTSADGAAFIESFYQKSRLHHLSTWKAELKVLVREAAKRDPGILDQEPQPRDGVKTNTTATNFFNPSSNQTTHPPRDKTILHADFDCFFASVGVLDRSHLRDKPVVVCHAQVSGEDHVVGTADADVSEKDLWEGKHTGKKASMSEVSSANYAARAFGIKNGMLLQKARSLCPQLVTIPYEFDKYKRISLQLYSILLRYADDLEAVSVDEAFLDVTSAVKRMKAESIVDETVPADHADMLAQKIRKEVKDATGCDVSIGVGQNVLLARIATRFAKPAISRHPTKGPEASLPSTSESTSTPSTPILPLNTGTFHLLPSHLRVLLSPLPLTTLPGVGPAIASKAAERLNGASTVGDIMRYPKAELCAALGQAAGEGVYWGVRGIEKEERKLVGVLSGEVEGGSAGEGGRKSVSAEINYGIRFQDNTQVESFMNDLGVEVSRRLNEIHVRGRMLTLKVLTRAPGAPVETPKFLGCGHCVSTSRQSSLPGATSSASLISSHAWALLKALNLDPKELRGIGIQITKLESAEASASEMVQKTLGFKSVELRKAKAEEKRVEKVETKPVITIQPPSSDADMEMKPPPTPKHATPKQEPDFYLPSYSQVDKDVLSALPDDVRQELTEEYSRRSATPTADTARLDVPHDSSKPSPPPEDSSDPSSTRKTPASVRKVTDRGTPLSRITQALSPRNRSSISPYKSKLFSKRNVPKEGTDGPSTPRVGGVKVTDAELVKLGIDAEVFRALPHELQSEQLARARFAKSFGEGESSKGKGKKRA